MRRENTKYTEGLICNPTSLNLSTCCIELWAHRQTPTQFTLHWYPQHNFSNFQHFLSRPCRAIGGRIQGASQSRPIENIKGRDSAGFPTYTCILITQTVSPGPSRLPSMIHAILALALVLGCTLTGASSLPSPCNAATRSATFRNIVVFGDSFSDDGTQGSPFYTLWLWLWMPDRSWGRCHSISNALT